MIDAQQVALTLPMGATPECPPSFSAPRRGSCDILDADVAGASCCRASPVRRRSGRRFGAWYMLPVIPSCASSLLFVVRMVDACHGAADGGCSRGGRGVGTSRGQSGEKRRSTSKGVSECRAKRESEGVPRRVSRDGMAPWRRHKNTGQIAVWQVQGNFRRFPWTGRRHGCSGAFDVVPLRYGMKAAPQRGRRIGRTTGARAGQKIRPQRRR